MKKVKVWLAVLFLVLSLGMVWRTWSEVAHPAVNPVPAATQAPEAVPVAAALAARAFARAVWSYNWRTGEGAAVRAAGRWATPALRGRLAVRSAGGPPTRRARREVANVGRVMVAADELTGTAVGLAVFSEVTIRDAGGAPRVVPMAADLLLVPRGAAWLVARIDQ